MSVARASRRSSANYSSTPSENDGVSSRLRVLATGLAAWTLIAALFSVQRLVSFAAKGVSPAWDQLAIGSLIPWGAWALLTPVILAAVTRLPLDGKPARLLLHLPIGIGVGIVHSFIVASITPLFLWRPSLLPIRDMFAGRLASSVAVETLIYCMVAAVLYTWRLRDERQRLELRLAEVTSPDHHHLGVPTPRGLIRVPIASIEWVQADDNYVRLHTNGRSHLLRGTLADLERRLGPSDFVRVHRSTMVRLGMIARLERTAANRYSVVLTNGVELRVSRAHRRAVESLLRGQPTP